LITHATFVNSGVSSKQFCNPKLLRFNGFSQWNPCLGGDFFMPFRFVSLCFNVYSASEFFVALHVFI